MVTPSGLLPDSTAIGRVALRVDDRERVARFYEDVLGLEATATRDGQTVLSAGEDPLLVLLEDADAPSRAPDEAGLFHTAIRVPSRGALGDVVARIETRWTLDGTADHLVSEALYLTDPEGNGVEVYRDYPREAWPIADDGTIGIDTKPLDVAAVRATADGRDDCPPGTDVGHVHLEVTSLAAARDFYVDGLGLEITQRYRDSALFLAAGGYHHHVGLNVWNRRTAQKQGRGLGWFEIVVPNGVAVAAVRERLQAAGVETRDVGDGFSAADPGGIGVRVREKSSV